MVGVALTTIYVLLIVSLHVEHLTMKSYPPSFVQVGATSFSMLSTKECLCSIGSVIVGVVVTSALLLVCVGSVGTVATSSSRGSDGIEPSGKMCCGIAGIDVVLFSVSTMC